MSPICWANRRVRYPWVQPTSAAIRAIGTAPALSASTCQARATSGVGCGPYSSRASSAASNRSNLAAQSGVAAIRSTNTLASGPRTSPVPTARFVNSLIGRPNSRYAPSGVNSTRIASWPPGCVQIAGRSSSPTTNDPMFPLPASGTPSRRTCENGSARLINRVARAVGTNRASYGVATASQ